MTGSAIIMMIIAMLVLWGGLVLAVVNLSKSDAGQVEELHRDL